MKSIYSKLLIPLLVTATVAAPALSAVATGNEHIVKLYKFVKNNPSWIDYLSTEAERAIIDVGCKATGNESLELYQKAIEYAQQRKDMKVAATLKKRIQGQRIGIFCAAIAGAVAILAISKLTHSRLRRHINSHADEPIDLGQDRVLDCGICFDQKQANDFAALSCRHTYCRECLEHIVDQAIRERTTAQMRCPAGGCAQTISQRDTHIITRNNPVKIGALSEIAAREWLLRQPNARQCPSPNCAYAFINGNNNRQSMQCPSCNNRYCANCLINHPNNRACQPAPVVDRNSAEWIARNTKPCPSCNARIEKNAGCLHMTCQQCRHQFCWNCRGVHHVWVCDQPAA